MRVLTWCCLGVALIFTGCTHECAAPPTSEAKGKASAKECSDDDCCSSVTRAGLLKKSVEAKVDSESK